jgi:hypothetical protein
MISRRELIRRITLGIAGASVPAGIVAKEIAKPFAAKPVSTDGIRLTINSVEIGNVIDVTTKSAEMPVIDVTNLSSTASDYIKELRDIGTVDVRAIAVQGADLAIHDTFLSGDAVSVKLEMNGDVYEFDSYIRGCDITQDADPLIWLMIDLSLEVLGKVHIS